MTSPCRRVSSLPTPWDDLPIAELGYPEVLQCAEFPRQNLTHVNGATQSWKGMVISSQTSPMVGTEAFVLIPLVVEAARAMAGHPICPHNSLASCLHRDRETEAQM